MQSPSRNQSNSATAYIVIPARKNSTRLPNKLLLKVDDKSILQHTYEAACRADRARNVWVATDHPAIIEEVQQFGGLAMLTSADCQSGTDRVAEVAGRLPEADIIVNVQGDEPEVDPSAVDRLIEKLRSESSAAMATLASPLADSVAGDELLADPACVKVVFDDQGRALYFSRSAIPYVRDPAAAQQGFSSPTHYQHIGVYAYRRDFLLRMAATPPSPLERLENLEQLRVLQLGETILVEVVAEASRGIDTRADYEAFVARRRAG